MPSAMTLNLHGLWGQTACDAPPTRPLGNDIEVDIAVVGAGYTGLSAALHLSESGDVRVAVLEARDIGFGASGRNAGLVNAGAWLRPDELPRRLGPDYGGRLLDTLGEGPALVFDLIGRHNIACDAVHNGTLHCAVGSAGLTEIRERARQWQAHGVPVRLLSAQETADKVGASAYAGALLDPRAGTIQPLSYARGLARAAIASGVSLYTDTALMAAEPLPTGWRLSTSTGNTVRAGRVLVATSTAQEPGPDAWPQLQAGLVRFPYFNIATAPLPRDSLARILPEGQGAWDTCTVLSSFRMDATGRLVYGSVGAVSPLSRDTHVQWVRRCLARLFPELRDIPIDYQWYGWIDITDNQLPYLQHLAPNVWALGGYNGRGIGPGTVLGRAMAEMLLGRRMPDDMPLPIVKSRVMSHKRLRELFYEKGSKVAHLLSKRF